MGKEGSAEQFHNCNQANIIKDFLLTIFPELCLSASHQNKQVQLKKTGPYSSDHGCPDTHGLKTLGRMLAGSSGSYEDKYNIM